MASLELYFEEEENMEDKLHPKSQEKQETAEERAVELSQSLEESKDKEFIKARLPELFKILEEELGLNILKGPEEISAIYKAFQTKQCLVRVERFTKILETIELNREFIVGESAGDSHYANAVIPEPEGIKIAWAEGQASGPIKVAFGLGLGKSIIGMKGDSTNFKVSSVDFSEDDQRDIEKRSYLCRHVEGEVKKDDILGVVMRIPRNVVADQIMTEKEVENKESPFVFRGFLLG